MHHAKHAESTILRQPLWLLLAVNEGQPYWHMAPPYTALPFNLAKDVLKCTTNDIHACHLYHGTVFLTEFRSFYVYHFPPFCNANFAGSVNISPTIWLTDT